MGISWGGGLAQEFARKFPNRVERLVLAATSSGHLMVPPNLSVMLKMATPLRYLSAGYFRSIAGQIYGGDFRQDPDRAERHARLMTPPSVWGYLSQIYALTGWTSLFWLHRITAPTLVLAGEDDPIIPLVNARIITARLPNARLSTYDCGHLFVLTRLEAVSAEIDGFLTEGVSDYEGDALAI
jgi:poly(3-hydroxyalkanoate) depolymerase